MSSRSFTVKTVCTGHSFVDSVNPLPKRSTFRAMTQVPDSSTRRLPSKLLRWFLVSSLWMCLFFHLISASDLSTSATTSTSTVPRALIAVNNDGDKSSDDEAQTTRRLAAALPFPFGDQVRDIVYGLSRRGSATLTRSIPALSVFSVRKDDGDDKDGQRHRRGRRRPRRDDRFPITEVAVKQKTQPQRQGPSIRLPSPADVRAQFLRGNGGFYYGIDPKRLTDVTTGGGGNNNQQRQRRPQRLKDSMYEALDELRLMRQEMEALRREMQILKRKITGEGGDEADDDSQTEEGKARLLKLRRKKQKEAEKLAKEIENWAHAMLQEGEDEGWKQVECNKMVRGTLNAQGRTTAYIKWMKDSRQSMASPDDNNDYPCIKCYATIDAPLEDVCTYLSQESASADYNDVVEKHRDVEELSPSAKICWSQSPQILFIKPRDFVTFCHHRWRGDGTEVIVNQACDHPEFPVEAYEKDGKSCRGFALRGANFLSRSPEDPSKTQITIIAHANPGGGLPLWASKTAVNALAPIEPFKLFHKINENVKLHQPELRERLAEAEMVSNLPPGRSPRPAGMAQLGYACFWPKGGGRTEGNLRSSDSSINSETEGTTPLPPNGQGDESRIQIGGTTSNDSSIYNIEEETVDEAPEMIALDSS